MIDGYGVDEINEVVTAYRNLSQSPEFQIMETQRIMAAADEAQRMSNAEERGAEHERERWEGVVADRDAALADKDAENAELRKQLAELQAKAES